MLIRKEKFSDKDQVKKLWNICFGDTAEFTDWFFAERFLPEYGIVAEENGIITAAMQGWPYTLNIRGQDIPAVMLAGVSTGVFESLEKAVEKCNQVISITTPNEENTQKYKEVFRKYKAVQKALEPIYNGEF